MVHINVIKHEQNMIITIDAKKAFDKIHFFMRKTVNKVGIEGTYHNILKAIYDKVTLYLTVRSWKLRSLARQVCPLSSLFQIMEVPAREIRQAKAIKFVLGKEGELSLSANDMIYMYRSLNTLYTKI